MKVDERSDQKSDIKPHWMAVHVRLKNEFMEDEKYHNLMRWLIYNLALRLSQGFVRTGTGWFISGNKVTKAIHQILNSHKSFTHIEIIWAAPREFGTYRLCQQRRFRRACASAQSRQNLRCSLIQAVSQEEPSDRQPDPWPLWMAGHAQLKFVMTECSKTQIRLTRPI